MKTKTIFFIIIMICLVKANAQPSDIKRYFVADSLIIHKWYAMNASELIFSFGEVKSQTKAEPQATTLDNVVRFTIVFNFQRQFHYNFNNTFGLFTGFGIRNVGLINKIPVDSSGSATVKQRSYSLGVPLALKIGNMKEGVYLALGAEAELMFAYKQKILFNDQKYKSYDWFSDKVNIINPSVFADIRFNHGSYIRFKYYLMDFLKNTDMSFLPPQSLTFVQYQPVSSKMMYIAIGAVMRDRSHKKHHETKTDI